MATTLYGIPNCETVKKARKWLEARDIAYQFHDYKKAGINADRLNSWADALGWEKLLNRAGTTFRKLPEGDRAHIDRDKAIMLMVQNPSMIKRPLLDHDGALTLGYSQAEYEALLG